MMYAVLIHALREAMSRRMAVALLGVSLFMSASYLWNIRFEPSAAGGVLVRQGPNVADVQTFVLFNYPNQLNISGWLWLMLGVFTAAPLLTSYLEKGWAELLLSKRVPRWQMLLGRYLAVVLLFAVSLVFINVLPALHVWRGTGHEPWTFLTGVSLILLSFASLVALMNLVAVIQPHAGLVIIAGFIQISLSRILADRRDLYDLFTSIKPVAPVLDAVHFVTPRNTELLWAAIDLVHLGGVDSWTPVWATLLFTVVALALACFLLHRKSI